MTDIAEKEASTTVDDIMKDAKARKERKTSKPIKFGLFSRFRKNRLNEIDVDSELNNLSKENDEKTEANNASAAGVPNSAGSKLATLSPKTSSNKSSQNGTKSKDLQKRLDEIAIEEEGETLPLMVNVDFYRGVTKPREVEGYARSFIEKNFEAPNASYYFVQKWREGIVVEMQMGGGLAYLPHLINELSVNPKALVALPMSNRVMTVRYDETIDRLECFILPLGQKPPENAIILRPSKAMQPFDKRGSNMFYVGIATLFVSLIVMGFSIGTWFLDVNAWAVKNASVTRAKDLPSLQVDAVNKAALAGDCVAKLEFKSGVWKATTGYALGDQCSVDQAAALSAKNLEMAQDVAPLEPRLDQETNAVGVNLGIQRDVSAGAVSSSPSVARPITQ